jgi:hypothetical protein
VKCVLVLLLVVTSCTRPTGEPIADGYELTVNDPGFQGKAVLRKLSISTGFKILLMNAAGEITDETVFRYAPYRLDTADVNRDGKTDVLVGLIKSTDRRLSY